MFVICFSFLSLVLIVPVYSVDDGVVKASADVFFKTMYRSASLEKRVI